MSKWARDFLVSHLFVFFIFWIFFFGAGSHPFLLLFSSWFLYLLLLRMFQFTIRYLQTSIVFGGLAVLLLGLS